MAVLYYFMTHFTIVTLQVWLEKKFHIEKVHVTYMSVPSDLSKEMISVVSMQHAIYTQCYTYIGVWYIYVSLIRDLGEELCGRVWLLGELNPWAGESFRLRVLHIVLYSNA